MAGVDAAKCEFAAIEKNFAGFEGVSEDLYRHLLLHCCFLVSEDGKRNLKVSDRPFSTGMQQKYSISQVELKFQKYLHLFLISFSSE